MPLNTSRGKIKPLGHSLHVVTKYLTKFFIGNLMIIEREALEKEVYTAIFWNSIISTVMAEIIKTSKLNKLKQLR